MASQGVLIEDFERFAPNDQPDEAPPPEPNTGTAGKGRPRGARNKKHKALEHMARASAPALLQKLIAAANGGDMAAMKIIFDRIWPRPRTAPITLELPKTETPADVRAAMLEIIQRVARGEVTSDDGAAIVRMMKDILDAHSIKTLSPESDNESLSGDARQVFSERLARIIEARAVPADDAAED